MNARYEGHVSLIFPQKSRDVPGSVAVGTFCSLPPRDSTSAAPPPPNGGWKKKKKKEVPNRGTRACRAGNIDTLASLTSGRAL